MGKHTETKAVAGDETRGKENSSENMLDKPQRIRYVVLTIGRALRTSMIRTACTLCVHELSS